MYILKYIFVYIYIYYIYNETGEKKKCILGAFFGYQCSDGRFVCPP